MVYELPYPPTVNHYWRRVGERTLISCAGRAYRRRVMEALAEQRADEAEGSVAVIVHVQPPDRRRRDLDNILKALLDALQHGGAYQDDSQIDHLEVIRGEPERPDGRVLVTVIERGV